LGCLVDPVGVVPHVDDAREYDIDIGRQLGEGIHDEVADGVILHGRGLRSCSERVRFQRIERL